MSCSADPRNRFVKGCTGSGATLLYCPERRLHYALLEVNGIFEIQC